jgi:Arc/MetJ-type ribon-helix-helix transcriptional regulator
MKTIQTQVPEQLYQQLHSLIADGWFRDEEELLREALRRFLETHRPDLMEHFMREDVKWGLHGGD